MIYDALVIGGGPAGSTAARMLARAGWSVALVEKKPFPRRKVCGEFISATSLPLLQAAGLSGAFAAAAGPEVRRVAIFAGARQIAAEMPRAMNDAGAWGRALGRETLDVLLMQAATRAGAQLWQPFSVASVARENGCFVCRLEGEATERLRSRIVVLANGSWERSPVPGPQHPHRASDLFAFKAHFCDCDLAPELMPLIAFPGGYGGMVHTDKGRVSLSCCIRRDVLADCRSAAYARHAGEAVLQHIVRSSAGVREALRRAQPSGAWLSAGPVRPGIRRFYEGGMFFVGNAAGEAHPIIAEGISMAIQSGSLLAEHLIGDADAALGGAGEGVGRAYERQWRRRFALRLNASAALAKLAMRAPAAAIMAHTLRALPGLLTFGARISGKAADHPLRGAFGASQPSRRAIR
jgi:flavin-dependent dehydrogenase